jgi:hypothetical protein
VRVHLATEHALELELAHGRLEAGALLLELCRGALVALGLGHREQLERVARAVAGAVEFADGLGEADAFLAQFLGTLGLGPDLRVLELADYFFEAITLVIVLKETPSRRRNAPRCRAVNGAAV